MLTLHQQLQHLGVAQRVERRALGRVGVAAAAVLARPAVEVEQLRERQRDEREARAAGRVAAKPLHERRRDQPHGLALLGRRVARHKQRLHRPDLGGVVARARRRLELLRQPPEGAARAAARREVRQQVLRVRVRVLPRGARLGEVAREALELRRRRRRGRLLEAAREQAVEDLKVRRERGGADGGDLVGVALRGDVFFSSAFERYE